MSEQELSEQMTRWRLILGQGSQESLEQSCGQAPQLSKDQRVMDEALAAIYDGGGSDGDGSARKAGIGPGHNLKLSKWLGDIRSFFKEDVVTVIQQDAIERRGLTQLLFEPEALKAVTPSVSLVGTLLSLSGQIPERTKETARQVVREVVEQIRLDLEQPIRQAVMGALNRREHSPIPNVTNIDWKWTIGRNLKNYQPELGTIVPERVYFFSRAQRSNNWTVIVDLDQSGSMADSVVYGSVMGAIFASLPATETRVVAFDTEVVDLTETCGDDPVDMLFGVQLGGGTDINKSVAYCSEFIHDPAKTIFVLISDLYEGGVEAGLIRRMTEMVASGVKAICLLALSDSGTPSYDQQLARKLAKVGVPSFACNPARLPELVEGVMRGHDLAALAERIAPKKQKRPPQPEAL